MKGPLTSHPISADARQIVIGCGLMPSRLILDTSHPIPYDSGDEQATVVAVTDNRWRGWSAGRIALPAI